MVNNVNSLKNVQIFYNSNIHQVLGNDYNVTGIVIKNTTTSSMKELKVNFVFIGLEEKPISSFVHYQGVVDDEGFIIANNDGATKEAGLYAIGDVVEGSTKQLVNAMASGNSCGQAIISYLQSIKK